MMRTRRLVTFVLGAWLGASLFMIWVATENMRSVRRIVETPSGPAERFAIDAGKDRTASFMRYQAAEMNRALFSGWGVAQTAIGAVLFLILLFGTSAGRLSLVISGLMLFLTLIMTFYLMPEMEGLGRASDYFMLNQSTPERGRFRMLHGVYASMESVKILLGLVLTGVFLLGGERGERRRRSKSKVNAVDYADHRHIDG